MFPYLTPPKASGPAAEPGRQPGHNGWFLLAVLFVLGCLGLGVLLIQESSPEPPFYYDDSGNPQAQPGRLKKMQKELDKLDEAEQYVLVATEPGWYPCFNCPDTKHIYLLPGEIWKIGVTTNGPSRYPKSFYKENKLQYISQFKGTLQECLREEKKKIYHYPILPENIKREKPILRPPGNKKDS